MTELDAIARRAETSPAGLAGFLPARPGVGPADRILRVLYSLQRRLAAWFRPRRRGSSLDVMNDHILRDIGLAWSDLGQDPARPTWQTWR